jgi:hypothetical protein
MFIRGKTYRHMNCLDVDMYVSKVVFVGLYYYKIKVIWLDRNNPDLNYGMDRVRLMRKDVNKWSEV